MSDRDSTLWVAATPSELAVLPGPARQLVTGVGPASAAGTLARHLALHPGFERVVGIGIAGAYPGSGLEIGQVVRVVGDRFIDLGAETESGFRPLWDLGIPGISPAVPEIPPKWSSLDDLKMVQGATCSVCTGSQATAHLRSGSGAQVESMEGAAWEESARQAQVPFFQIRAISNVAGPRDRGSWNIPMAIENLRRTLLSIWSSL